MWNNQKLQSFIADKSLSQKKKRKRTKILTNVCIRLVYKFLFKLITCAQINGECKISFWVSGNVVDKLHCKNIPCSLMQHIEGNLVSIKFGELVSRENWRILNLATYWLWVHAMLTAAAMTIAVFTTLSAALVASMYSCTALSRSWSFRSIGLPCAFVGKHFTTGASLLFFSLSQCSYVPNLQSSHSWFCIIFQPRPLEKCLAAWVFGFKFGDLVITPSKYRII